jgi:hypothetical protein
MNMFTQARFLLRKSDRMVIIMRKNGRLRHRRYSKNPYKLLDLLTLFTSSLSSFCNKKGENEATKLRFRSNGTKELKGGA